MIRKLSTWRRHVPSALREHSDRGATMVEYAMLFTFIAMVALAGVKILGTTVRAAFTSFAGSL